MIPRLKPYYDHREFVALLNPTNRSGAIERYEQAFAKKFGCEYGTMFAHGRTGIYALLKAWDLEDDEVICPAYTCVVVQHAICLSGNVPVFVDSSESDFNMELGLLEKAITEKTRAIIVTHLFGYPMNVKAVQNMVAQAESRYGHKIYVIQDVAHSFGAKWEGELVTTYGDAAVFGLNISKILNSIFGGMVITSNGDTHAALADQRQELVKGSPVVKSVMRVAYFLAVNVAFSKVVFGMTSWLQRKGFLDRFTKYYAEDTITFPGDWNSPPTNTEAVVGLVQLEKYDEIIQKRRKVALAYANHMPQQADIRFMPDFEGATYSHCVAVISDRDTWVKDYAKKGVELGILIEYSVPEMKAFAGYKRGEYPWAKHYADHCINFPNWPGVKARLS